MVECLLLDRAQVQKGKWWSVCCLTELSSHQKGKSFELDPQKHTISHPCLFFWTQHSWTQFLETLALSSQPHKVSCPGGVQRPSHSWLGSHKQRHGLKHAALEVRGWWFNWHFDPCLRHTLGRTSWLPWISRSCLCHAHPRPFWLRRPTLV